MAFLATWLSSFMEVPQAAKVFFARRTRRPPRCRRKRWRLRGLLWPCVNYGLLHGGLACYGRGLGAQGLSGASWDPSQGFCGPAPFLRDSSHGPPNKVRRSSGLFGPHVGYRSVWEGVVAGSITICATVGWKPPQKLPKQAKGLQVQHVGSFSAVDHSWDL